MSDAADINPFPKAEQFVGLFRTRKIRAGHCVTCSRKSRRFEPDYSIRRTPKDPIPTGVKPKIEKHLQALFLTSEVSRQH
jgi:hypothetical protein